MWHSQIHDVGQTGTTRITLVEESESLSYSDVIKAMQHNDEFRSWFNSVLAGASFSAFRWESCPVTKATLGEPYEFVLIDSPRLDRPPEPDAFAEHLNQQPDRDTIVIPNLGGDAILVVPRALATTSVYGHLASFVRGAPEHQRDTFWRTVANTMADRVGLESVWLNTAGAGVPWLHVRIDKRPKYYRYAPYRDQSA